MWELSEETNDVYEKLKKEKSDENIIAFILSFFKTYRVTQGYYDYFKVDGSPAKVHYEGKLKRFLLQEEQSDLANFHFVFHCEGKSITKLPSSKFEEKDGISKYCLEDVKKRAIEDTSKIMMEDLDYYLNPYIDIHKIKITMIPNWSSIIVGDPYFWD